MSKALEALKRVKEREVPEKRPPKIAPDERGEVSSTPETCPKWRLLWGRILKAASEEERDELAYRFGERAGIQQYDGEQPREAAEEQAARAVAGNIMDALEAAEAELGRVTITEIRVLPTGASNGR